jgi:hypothetical protein
MIYYSIKIYFIIYFIISNIILWFQYNSKQQLFENYSKLKNEIEKKYILEPLVRLSYINRTSLQKNDFLGIGIPSIPFQLNNNKIYFPKEIKRVWIDIGAHKEAMNTRPSLEVYKLLIKMILLL